MDIIMRMIQLIKYVGKQMMFLGHEPRLLVQSQCLSLIVERFSMVQQATWHLNLLISNF
jgi:hypothetical protein